MTKPCFVNPSNEDYLKILKVEYLSNCFLDHTQILNLDSGDQSKVFKYFKWRQPSMEENLKTSWRWAVPRSVQVGLAKPAIDTYANLHPSQLL